MRVSSFVFVALLLTAPVVPATTAAASAERPVTVVSGTVRDAQGAALGGVTVHAGGARLSDVTTGRDGWFRLAVVDVEGSFYLGFSRAGFADERIEVRCGAREHELQVVMRRKPLAVELTGFEPGRRLRGTVSGLAAGEHQALKVVVYVLTDRWYLHPWAEPAPGRGFALLGEDGGWEIETVSRRHQATRLALLVVPVDAWSPPALEAPPARPEEALSRRLSPLAITVLEAPPGI